jgi:signal transduction histidine kinase
MNSGGGTTRAANSGVASRPAGELFSRPTHVLSYCQDDGALTVSAAGFLADGIASGEPVMVFATPARREAMCECLRERGLDVDYLERESRLTLLDARATLATFMVGDLPDAHKFSHSVGAAVERLCTANHGSPVRAFGEMVSLLWLDGNTRAAIRLEELWGELTGAQPLLLLSSDVGGEFLTVTGSAERAAHFLEQIRSVDDDAVEPVAESDDRPDRALVERTAKLERELEERKVLEARLREALVARKVIEEELQRASVERERLLQREREARAEAEAANRAKAEFLSVMSHELRTPLNAIGGHVQLIELELHGPVTAAQRDALGRIARSQHHLLMLVNDVLNLARLEAGQMDFVAEELDLSAVVKDVVDGFEPLMRRGGLTYELKLPPANAPPLIAAVDGEKVRQILLNLLTNAVKFTRSGGELTISVAESSVKRDALVVTVRDTGLGIAAVRLRRVFEPFGQEPQGTVRHLDGTGLSLAISRDLARGMGGELTAESVPGEGSTFTLEVPRSAPGAPASRADGAHSRISAHSREAAQPSASS